MAGELNRVKLLIADDDPTSLLLVTALARKWNYEAVTVRDGLEAWRSLEADALPLAILDRQMPGLDGLEICRRVRASPKLASTYLILITSEGAREEIVKGLEAGADDYVTKPFHPEELRARIAVGVRLVSLQARLAQRVKALEETLAQVRRLEGLIPMCAWCKKVRNDQDYWQEVSSYLTERSEARFTHAICKDCFKRQGESLSNSLERSLTEET